MKKLISITFIFFLFLFLWSFGKNKIQEHHPAFPVLSAGKLTDAKKVKIALVPFKGVDTAYCSLLKKEIEAFYPCEVVVRKPENLPAFAYYKPRGRYKADSLIKYLDLHIPENCSYVLGITDKDISTKDEIHEDWGIFGLGLIGGPGCVVSDFRLKKSAKNKQHLQERLVKVTLHELGHTFGLQHCTADPKCLMEAANGTIASVDREEKYLCKSCRSKLKIN